MADPTKRVFTPATINDLFSTWNSVRDAVLCAGGITQSSRQGGGILDAGRNIISLDKMEELRRIRRTERYLEIGSMVKLSQIMNLGKIVPEVVTRCLEHLASPQLRNQATLGGNICYPDRRLDLSGPMIALDAQYELRTAQSARWIPAFRFSSHPAQLSLAPQELLTRIRIPLEPWLYTWYRKVNNSGPNRPGGGILCIMRNQKDILTDIRFVYSDEVILRVKNSESMLAGKHLPLENKDKRAFAEVWESYLDSTEHQENSILLEKKGSLGYELIKAQIIQFIEATLLHISD